VFANVSVGKSTTDNFTTVQADSVVDDVVSVLGVYIDFSVNKLPEVEDNTENAKGNVFQMMMAVHIDGHYQTLAAQGCSVPSELLHFQGFNIPETHGHKRKHDFEQQTIEEHSLALLHLTQQSYMKSKVWSNLREVLLRLATNLRKYSSLLIDKNEKTKQTHLSLKPVENSSIEIREPKISMKPTIYARYKRLNEAVMTSEYYSPIHVNDFSPSDKFQRFDYIKNLTLNCSLHLLVLENAHALHLENSY